MAYQTYQSFDLWITQVADRYRIKGWDANGREATVNCHMPFSELEVENFWLRIGRPRRGMRRAHSVESEALKSLGGGLFKAVFHGELLSCFRASLEEARSKEAGLRIRLRLNEVPELAALPWEYLYDSSFNRFLARSIETPIVRYLELPERIQPLAVAPPLRMLVMVSNPEGYAELGVEQEWTQLGEALGELSARGLIELQRLDKATLSKLQQALRRAETHIFHFIGHGGFGERAQEGVLILEDESGRGLSISNEDLAAVLHDHSSLRLAVLNACEGARTSRWDIFAGTAQSLIRQGLPAVVAMQSEVTDESALTSSREFYRALADGYPVDASLTEARKVLSAEGSVEWGSAVLFLRAPDGHIFDFRGKTAPGCYEEASGGISVSGLSRTKTTRVWNVPYRRNPFFTGREDTLENLHQAFNYKSSMVQGISGLGGIGKIQTAVAYAYRFRDEYDAVLWSAASSEADLVTGFVEIAQALGLPEKETSERETVQAVRRWLDTTPSWLLVLDNADEPELVEPFVPASGRGHLLVTSRVQDLGALDIVQPFRLEVLPPHEAVAFLLKRAGRTAPGDDERRAAMDLAAALGHLPLALEQAGAYLAAHPARLRDYLTSYLQRRLQVLAEAAPRQYPRSVATTWALNFEQIERCSIASAEILRLSAFLSPDRIPFELLTHGAGELGPVLSETLAGISNDPLCLGRLLEPLTRYSLVRVDPEQRTYSLHRLVQEVVKDTMGAESRQSWGNRAVCALNRAFPNVEYSSWIRCERLLPHTLTILRLLQEKPSLQIEEAGRLFNQGGTYSFERGRYAIATPLYRCALKIREKVFGDQHPYVATSLNNLAALYRAQARYDEAAPLYHRALEIRKERLGGDHPDVGASLNNLALLYSDQGRYDEAAPLIQRALGIWEGVHGTEHTLVATSLNNLANLYRKLGRCDEALPLLRRALGIWERVVGADHPNFAESLNNLANLYRALGRYPEASRLCQQALEIRKKVIGGEHPRLADSLNTLANIFRDQGRHEAAEAFYQQALGIREKALGSDHPYVAESLSDFADLYRAQVRYDEAEPLYLRALEIREKALAPAHPELAATLENYAALLRKLGRKEEAGRLEARARTIRGDAA